MDRAERLASLRKRPPPVVIKRRTRRKVDYPEPKPGEVMCSICLDTLRRRKMRALPCEHEFHELCVRDWLNSGDPYWFKTCPLCRKPLHNFGKNSSFFNELLNLLRVIAHESD
ncbi:hypothetical protein CEXT_110611 [Caerostris extrusa]|uniref:RING-type domain-containing protein n=1 Tax=Caerostris extrusa TaxID=172846 RepID=A0AAV4MPP5_CAEEX|nr:hypothetical protein CEXT_110611 [Caerostris extrusa]